MTYEITASLSDSIGRSQHIEKSNSAVEILEVINNAAGHLVNTSIQIVASEDEAFRVLGMLAAKEREIK